MLSKKKHLLMQCPFDMVFFQSNFITLSVDSSFDRTLSRNIIANTILSWHDRIHYFSSFNERVSLLDNNGNHLQLNQLKSEDTIPNLVPPHAYQTPQNNQNKTRHIIHHTTHLLFIQHQ
mmetsp:Transcript_18269/g.38200  ORF Transcript_18269/g.38200 Transcript_18269/m.38200 type:complete len:119 (+) Transcript_18269:417-773(+)